MTIQYTPRFQLPFPQRTDTSDVPRDIAALANSLEALINQLIPIGALHPWTVTAPPAGWLVCDGSALARAGTYAALFAVIGTTYNFGTVDPANFCLPNLAGRVPMGSVSGSPLGQSGGASSVTLNTSMIPSHSHAGFSGYTNTDHYHTGSISGSGSGSGGTNAATADGNGYNAPVCTNSGWGGFTPGSSSSGGNFARAGTASVVNSSLNHAHSFSVAVSVGGSMSSYWQSYMRNSVDGNNNDPNHRHSIPAEGGGGSHENMPPYQVVNYIIRYQ
jgi:microcystin-dependent protein